MSWWLFFMAAVIALMVIVGGATRLTDSGLSITEWKPVTGAIPPLSLDAWQAEFEKYKQIPEYDLVNAGMSLEEFKTIFWWEWGHRFLGRIIGFLFLLPLIFFVARGWVDRRLRWALFGLFVLGGAQGALGWYMVSSGLTERVDVSQYRLAAHLGLAIFLFGAMLWAAFDLRMERPVKARFNGIALGGLVMALGVFGQIILGAFVAGLRAGHTYTDWPLMDGQFIPAGYFNGAAGLSHMFETIAAVQFNHRIGAYILAGAVAWFYLAAAKAGYERRTRFVLMAVLAQVVLGIATLMAATPIGLGLAHQAGALVVLGTTLYALHEMATDTKQSSA